MGAEEVVAALQGFDHLYPQPNGESALLQLQIQLAYPHPYDLEETDLAEHKNLDPNWHDWETVTMVCAACAMLILRSHRRRRRWPVRGKLAPDVLRADTRTKLDGGPERSRPEQHGPRLVGGGQGEWHDQDERCDPEPHLKQGGTEEAPTGPAGASRERRRPGAERKHRDED